MVLIKIQKNLNLSFWRRFILLKQNFFGLTIFGKKINKIHTGAYANYKSDIFVSGNLEMPPLGYNILYNLKKVKCSGYDKKYFCDKFLPDPKIKVGINY